jgi:6-phosphofructokinase 2
MNPAIDISAAVPRVTPTNKLRCTSVRREAGGGGINVARVVSRLGAKAHAIFPIGGPIGSLLKDLVAGEGVASTPIAVTQDTRESFTVDEGDTGAQFRFVLPGPTLSTSELAACVAAAVEQSRSAKLLIAGGSLPAAAPDDFYAGVARAVKPLGVKVIVDTSGPALTSALEAGVFLIKPNLREFQELTGSPLKDRAAWIVAARDLIARSAVEVVVLTLGDRGALLVTRDQAIFAPAVPIQARSAVGAGDSFVGAIAWSLAQGHDLADAFRYGMAAGAAALLSPGTELCRAEDVMRLYPQVQAQQL